MNNEEPSCTSETPADPVRLLNYWIMMRVCLILDVSVGAEDLDAVSFA